MNGHSQPGPMMHTVSVGFTGVLGAQWFGWLPPIVASVASALAIVWYAIQIWESRTIRRWRRAAGWFVPPNDEKA